MLLFSCFVFVFRLGVVAGFFREMFGMCGDIVCCRKFRRYRLGILGELYVRDRFVL